VTGAVTVGADGVALRRPVGPQTLGQLLGVGILGGAVLTGQLGVAGLLIAAWVENVSVGVATVAALARDDRPPPPPGAPSPFASGTIDLQTAPKGCVIPFFLAHYGIFALVHGMFVATLSLAVVAGGGVGISAFGLLAVVASAVVRAFRRIEPSKAIGYAYAHVVPLHLALFVVGGGIGWGSAAAFGGSGAWPVPEGVIALALVGLFALSDLIKVGTVRASAT
jgi:hypothetical protein